MIGGAAAQGLAFHTDRTGQTHRSWWVAASAIEDVKWLRGRGEARLTNGMLVPISRSQAAPLKAAGWF